MKATRCRLGCGRAFFDSYFLYLLFLCPRHFFRHKHAQNIKRQESLLFYWATAVRRPWTSSTRSFGLSRWCWNGADGWVTYLCRWQSCPVSPGSRLCGWASARATPSAGCIPRHVGTFPWKQKKRKFSIKIKFFGCVFINAWMRDNKNPTAATTNGRGWDKSGRDITVNKLKLCGKKYRWSGRKARKLSTTFTFESITPTHSAADGLAFLRYHRPASKSEEQPSSDQNYNFCRRPRQKLLFSPSPRLY